MAYTSEGSNKRTAFARKELLIVPGIIVVIIGAIIAILVRDELVAALTIIAAISLALDVVCPEDRIVSFIKNWNNELKKAKLLDLPRMMAEIALDLLRWVFGPCVVRRAARGKKHSAEANASPPLSPYLNDVQGSPIISSVQSQAEEPRSGRGITKNEDLARRRRAIAWRRRRRRAAIAWQSIRSIVSVSFLLTALSIFCGPRFSSTGDGIVESLELRLTRPVWAVASTFGVNLIFDAMTLVVTVMMLRHACKGPWYTVLIAVFVDLALAIVFAIGCIVTLTWVPHLVTALFENCSLLGVDNLPGIRGISDAQALWERLDNPLKDLDPKSFNWERGPTLLYACTTLGPTVACICVLFVLFVVWTILLFVGPSRFDRAVTVLTNTGPFVVLGALVSLTVCCTYAMILIVKAVAALFVGPDVIH